VQDIRILLAIRFVATARYALESAPVKNRDFAPGIFDESTALQVARGIGDPDAANAEHVGKEMMSYIETVFARPILGHQ
jgi:hypothetical protein